MRRRGCLAHRLPIFLTSARHYVLLSAIGRLLLPAPRLWNSLPADIPSALSLTTFRRKLKTYLFRQSYQDIVL